MAKGASVIPGSGNPKHIKENLDTLKEKMDEMEKQNEEILKRLDGDTARLSAPALSAPNGAAGTAFFDPDLNAAARRGEVRRGVLDRYCIIVMGGIAAEATADPSRGPRRGPRRGGELRRNSEGGRPERKVAHLAR